MDSTTLTITQELFAAAESSSFAGIFLPEHFSLGPDTYEFNTPLNWNVLVSNTGGALLVTGVVSGVGNTACARCLEEVQVPIQGEIEGYFLLGPEQEVELQEGEEEEFDLLGPDNTIDLIPLLEAAIRCDLPLQPLCKTDCAGLCPDCGINLNEETCACAMKRAQENAEFEAAKNPFASLRELEL